LLDSLLQEIKMDAKKRKFPLKMNLEEISEKLKERKFVVVSFFGKTTLSSGSNKGAYIDEATRGSQFKGSDTDSSEIEMVVDADKDVIYLHMRSCYDTFTMAEKCKRFEETLLNKGFLSFWSSKRYEHAKALLFIFQVSHILVCVQPGHTVDISYIHLFKSLDNLRNKLQSSVSRLIRDIPGLSKEWISQGRMCSPRVLFLFLSAPVSLRGNRGFRDDRKDTKSHKNPPIKRLEFSLEDQIYRILRKSRIITNVAANSLFALPVNQEFVYVETGEGGSMMDPTTSILNTLYSVLNGETEPNFTFSGPFYQQLINDEMRPRRCFSKFLDKHINQAFEKGFHDNVTKFGPPGGGSSLWEIPPLQNWIQFSESMFSFFTETLTSAEGHDNSHAMCDLRDDLEIETIFSELRCKKILPVALGVYEDNLPLHYNEEYHNAKILQALSVFSMQARGPASEKFAERLAAECTEVWRAGRQRCEELSLTGNLCINKKHNLPGQEALQDDNIGGGERVGRRVMGHSSGVQYIAACNCGRKQANREDPFTLYESNLRFYSDLEEECCSELEHYPFPVFNPPKVKERFELPDTTDHPLEILQPPSVHPAQPLANPPTNDIADIKPMEVEAEPSLETGGRPLVDEARTAGTPTIEDETDIILEVLENIHIDAPAGKSPSKVESLFARASSQFLPHMKTLGSAAGLKPEFTSWSLVLMGSSQVYSHSNGLGAMPGFMSSSKFLLPWEIPLKKATEAELAEKFPNILESAARRAALFTPEAPREKLTVKVFIGLEYECPRGHRFMVSGPDKPMKSSSTMRGAAQDLVSSDMPLYMACPCRLKAPPVAQLIRLHLVTPKAPVHITLLPQVQPVPGGPVFVTGWDTPAKLSISSYWVLRLPYVYWGEGGAHLPPLVPPTRDNLSGVLLKGCISFDENYDES